MKEITEYLQTQRDVAYKDFQAALIPTQDKDKVIGVRTPVLRKYAKELLKNDRQMALEFMSELPHEYFEENQLHAFIISEIKNYDECVAEIERYLPYVDNWATCDQMHPKVLRKNPESLYGLIKNWMSSTHTYTVRFGIELLMNFYLDDLFEEKFLYDVANVESDEYYVNMMSAWYFATALAKQWGDTVKILEDNILPVWVHNKTIQKARESFRITKEQKEYLSTLKRR